MKVLGIETSCDETGIAVYDTDAGLLAEALHSQIDLHKVYGGVVPELASRDHIKRVLPLVQSVLADAGVSKSELDAIAYTAGPGLIGALLVGASIGRSLAYGLGIPAIGVHHMEGHLLAPILEDTPPPFPFIGLLVSGGHSMLVDVKGIGHYEIMGESVDDAAGEAFDKTAKLLGLPYPGGPQIAKLATSGDNNRFHFPRPMTNRPGLNFSFSGLKTYARNTIQTLQQDNAALSEQDKADISAAFEDAVVDTLCIKCRRAIQQSGLQRLVIAGGVSANTKLRQKLEATLSKLGAKVYYASPKYCTDNGAMIALAGALRLQAGESQGLNIDVNPRWPIDQLTSHNDIAL